MFDPYHKWLGIPKNQRPPTYYQLLGISPEETDAEVITEAALRQVAHLRSYQASPYAQQCADLLNEIGQAKSILLNAAKRREYDARLARKGTPQAGSRANIPMPVARPTAPAPWAGTPMAALCESLVRNGLYTLDELKKILDQWTSEASDPQNTDLFRRWLSTRQAQGQNPPASPAPAPQRRADNGLRSEPAAGPPVTLPTVVATPPPPPKAPAPAVLSPAPAPSTETAPAGTSSSISETDLLVPQAQDGWDQWRQGPTLRDCAAIAVGALGTVAVAALLRLIGLFGR